MVQVKTVIGFDFGMRYIGVAIGTTQTMTVQPEKTLLACKGQPSWGELSKLLTVWEPNLLVVGVPVNLQGKEYAMTFASKNFILELKNRFHLPVYSAEERFTTTEARARLYEQGGFKALKKKFIDGLAAKLIVEGWLAEHCLSHHIG